MTKKKAKEPETNPFTFIQLPQDYDPFANIDKEEFACELAKQRGESVVNLDFLPGVDIDAVCGRKPRFGREQKRSSKRRLTPSQQSTTGAFRIWSLLIAVSY